MRVVDSHTEGEPTRVILSGGPDLGIGSMAQRAERLLNEHPEFYAAALGEPRGHDAMVGALIVQPSDPSCAVGVIFFNTVGNLGMCGHASIGLTVTLAHLGKLEPGIHRIETPVGIVTVDLVDQNTVRVTNVPSYRFLHNVTVEVDDLGPITGDIAWGGNWFFLTQIDHLALEVANVPELTSAAQSIRRALLKNNLSGADGAEIDHIELVGPPDGPSANGRNFVLCPGGAYDRSPCGTGCSAKIACLAEEGLLDAGDIWIQESVIGSRYVCSLARSEPDKVVVTIEGQGFVTSEAKLMFDGNDPFRNGITSEPIRNKP